MKSRDSLVRLKKFQAEEKRRRVAQIEAMISHVDESGKGEIEIQDFLKLMDNLEGSTDIDALVREIAAKLAFNLGSVKALLAKGDAAAAAGNLTQANASYDQARDLCRKLLPWFVGLASSFRGLDARIPREMDAKGREVLELQVMANLRLAAIYRRLNQPEVAVPLLVEVVKLVTPASPDGIKAYQTLVELGFVSTPYAGSTSEGTK
jgi:tetratricopeptide (TPR) repeat protein